MKNNSTDSNCHQCFTFTNAQVISTKSKHISTVGKSYINGPNRNLRTFYPKSKSTHSSQLPIELSPKDKNN